MLLKTVNVSVQCARRNAIYSRGTIPDRLTDSSMEFIMSLPLFQILIKMF